jgi:MarR family transcriptional regulator for hemolysin
MNDYRFDGSFLYYVRLSKKLYEQTLSQMAVECGLTLPEADVLSYLYENPEFDTARDVALYREVSRAYVSKAVESLVLKGLLNILHDKDDRRYQHLELTEKSKPLTERLHNTQLSFYETVTKGLSDEEFSAMMTAIDKCAKNLSELAQANNK